MEDSDIARLNAAAGTDWIAMEPQTADLLKWALHVAEQPEGLRPDGLAGQFPLGFGGENQHLPDEEEIETYRTLVDYHNLRVDKETSEGFFKIHGAALDLGGIGKGAACDTAAGLPGKR